MDLSAQLFAQARWPGLLRRGLLRLWQAGKRGALLVFLHSRRFRRAAFLLRRLAGSGAHVR